MSDTRTPRLKDKARGVWDLTGEGTPTALGLSAPDGTTYDDLTPGGGTKWQRIAGAWAQLSTSGGATSWAAITGKPTTLAGYGITDALSSSYVPAWSSISGKPTTISGYGITDAFTQSSGDARYLQLTGGTLSGTLSFSASSTVYGYIGVPATTGALVNDAAIGDLIFRSQSKAIRFSVNGGTSSAMLIDSTGVAIGGASIGGASLAILQGTNTVGLTIRRPAANGVPLLQLSDGVSWSSTLSLVAGTGNLQMSGSLLLGSDLYVNGGHGLVSLASGAAVLRFASGAPGYLDFSSGDSTVAGVRIYFNGAIEGYFYADSTGTSILNKYGQYGLTVARINSTTPGGTLFGTWSLQYGGATPAPIAGVVSSSSAPTSGNVYPPNTIWLVT